MLLQIQEEYNKKNGITPQTIRKSVRDTIKATIVEDIEGEYNISKDESISRNISPISIDLTFS